MGVKELRVEADYNFSIWVMGLDSQWWANSDEVEEHAIRDALDATEDRVNWVFGVYWQGKLVGLACNGKFYRASK